MTLIQPEIKPEHGKSMSYNNTHKCVAVNCSGCLPTQITNCALMPNSIQNIAFLTQSETSSVSDICNVNNIRSPPELLPTNTAEISGTSVPAIKNTSTTVSAHHQTLLQQLTDSFNQQLPLWQEYRELGYNPNQCKVKYDKLRERLALNKTNNAENALSAGPSSTQKGNDPHSQNSQTINEIFSQSAELLLSVLETEWDLQKLTHCGPDNGTSLAVKDAMQSHGRYHPPSPPSIYETKARLDELINRLLHASQALNQYQHLMDCFRQDSIKDSPLYQQLIDNIAGEMALLTPETNEMKEDLATQKENIKTNLITLLNDPTQTAIHAKFRQLIEEGRWTAVKELANLAKEMSASAKKYGHYANRIKRTSGNAHYLQIAEAILTTSESLDKASETFSAMKKGLKTLREFPVEVKQRHKNMQKIAAVGRNMAPAFRQILPGMQRGLKIDVKSYLEVFFLSKKHLARIANRIRNKLSAISIGKSESVTSDEILTFHAQLHASAIPVLDATEKLFSRVTTLETCLNSVKQYQQYLEAKTPRAKENPTLVTEQENDSTVEYQLQAVLEGLLEDRAPAGLIINKLKKEKRIAEQRLTAAKKDVQQITEQLVEKKLLKTLTQDVYDISLLPLWKKINAKEKVYNPLRSAVESLQQQTKNIHDLINENENGVLLKSKKINKISEISKALAIVKEEIKQIMLQTSGCGLNNYSRDGMLARAVSEWLAKEKEAFKEKGGNPEEFDTVAEPLITHSIKTAFCKKNDPQAAVFISRMRLAKADVENNLKLWRSMPEDIIKSIKQPKDFLPGQGEESKKPRSYLTGWGERRLGYWLMLAAVGGPDAWQRAISLDIASNLWLPQLRHTDFLKTALNYIRQERKLRQAVRPGEDDAVYEKQQLREYEGLKFMMQCFSFISPPLLPNMLALGATMFGLLRGDKYRDEFFYRLLQSTPMNLITAGGFEAAGAIVSALSDEPVNRSESRLEDVLSDDD